jgi:putative heme-binding domain-containing protein
LERIDRKPIGDRPNPALVLPIVKNDKAAARVRAYALTLLPANHSELTLDLLKSLASNEAEELQLEVVRTMIESPSEERRELLAEIAADENQKTSVRAAAIGGLAGDNTWKGQLIKLALGKDEALRDEAMRSLVGMPLADEDFAKLASLKGLPEAARLFGEAQSPPLNDLAAWVARTSGEGDAEAGQRIFFHSRVGYCSRCHRYDGRGNHVGPDLTKIGRQKNREQLLTAILEPARDVMPAYRQWEITMKDGRTHTGISLRKGSHSEDYLGADGKQFSVRLDQMDSRREVATSMMPEELPKTMTARELRDVLAFLQKRP